MVFIDHLMRGFSPPGSKFFRDFLNFYNLCPQEIGPNAITNFCQFQVFCEVYLQMEPIVPLFWKFFYINHQTEFTDGPSIELNGISVQRQKTALSQKPRWRVIRKDGIKTWFYCKNTAPEGENPLPVYMLDQLDATVAFLGWPSDEE